MITMSLSTRAALGLSQEYGSEMYLSGYMSAIHLSTHAAEGLSRKIEPSASSLIACQKVIISKGDDLTLAATIITNRIKAGMPVTAAVIEAFEVTAMSGLCKEGFTVTVNDTIFSKVETIMMLAKISDRLHNLALVVAYLDKFFETLPKSNKLKLAFNNNVKPLYVSWISETSKCVNGQVAALNG